ncbi:MAG: hypothetical protein D6732_26555 [Methanobacteriota archaeon]|nr:MAG: hypothetical protein D6732_26555 [Euryarchaeota archaeon]
MLAVDQPNVKGAGPDRLSGLLLILGDLLWRKNDFSNGSSKFIFTAGVRSLLPFIIQLKKKFNRQRSSYIYE